MASAYSQLYFGLAGAIVLIYLVIVVNFQSWLDPFIIITALPAALAGIVWMLFVTGTTLSVPALTGAIMCMGIATANSILLVSFAREGLAQGLDAGAAALEAGFTRFRPVLMTALAMIIGMLPMAFALGEGGEQNAPLGRAVIGGLLVATVATLFFVPTVFSVLHSRRERQARDAATPAARTDCLTGERMAAEDQRHEPATASPPPPSRSLRRLGASAAAAAIVIALLGILQRRGHEAEVAQWTRDQADSDRRRHLAAARRHQTGDGAAGHRAGLVRGADLRPRQRLSERLVFRLRRACEEGRPAGRDRTRRTSMRNSPRHKPS